MHKSEKLLTKKPLIYTAFSKRNFYFREFISAFVLKQGKVPLNPFMLFDYFLSDTVDRNTVREANNNLVMRSDEVWVFGSLSDGVITEIKLAENENKHIKYFKILKSKDIQECQKAELTIE